jgi:hypothetical protein
MRPINFLIGDLSVLLQKFWLKAVGGQVLIHPQFGDFLKQPDLLYQN